MKKKILIVAVLALFSVGLLMISKGFQKNYTDEPQPNAQNNNNNIVAKTGSPESSQKPAEEKPIDDKSSKTENKTENKEAAPSGENKSSNAQPNVIITDTIKERKITSGRIDITGKTVAEATSALLKEKGIAYKMSGVGETVYISMINNLKERAEGPSSGWCYYINGKKYSVGAGTYKLKGDEVLEWKFLKDGISQ